MTKENLGLWIVGLLAGFALIFSLIAAFKPVGVSVDQVKTIVDNAVSQISIPVVNLSSINQKLDKIEKDINEEDVWKDKAIELATNEWKKRDYKEIYKAIDRIYGDIDVRDDIIYVKIKDEKVTYFDVDDQDATVVQELKVKYENLQGDEKKVYLIVTTEIREGEVEDQEIEEK